MSLVQRFGPHKEYAWFNLNESEIKNISQVSDETGISEEALVYALDDNERARIEYDDDNDMFIIIYNVASRDISDFHYNIMPMTFFIKDQTMITISNDQNGYVVEEMKRYISRHEKESLTKFLFQTLYLVTKRYFPLVESMDRERIHLSNELRERTTRKNLFHLSDLETGITYFRTAARQNATLFDQLTTRQFIRTITEEEEEQLEDTVIEAKQLVEMTELSSEILAQLSNTYNSVLNNNLNETMRILTVLSILLTVPTIVTGFFGMNMELPIDDGPFAWIGTIIITILISIALAKFMNDSFDN
ncbi:magnesium transporter CorA family protein [Hutsoniella sourekii]